MSATSAPKSSSTRHKHSENMGSPFDYPSTSANGMDITKEELSRIGDALKKEEFRKMFFEYCEEIQDPENRKRYESEIVQLEKERGVDVQFIHPEPGFVIKTSVDGRFKGFVNIASCEKIAKPSNKPCLNPETGVRGISWALPLAQAPPRDDIDTHGKRCTVYDVIFHPDALHMGKSNRDFQQCLIDTALDAIEREFKVKLDRTNLKYPNLKYKGIARPTVIRKLTKNPSPETQEPHPLDHIYPTKPTADSATPTELPLKTRSTVIPEFHVPNYTITHRREVDLAECVDQPDARLNVTIPKDLVLEIFLPLLESVGHCQLDVTSRSLYLLSDKAGAKYRLKLDLPYTIVDAQGVARFDCSTRKLRIVLPVVQPSREEQWEMRETIMEYREDSGVESDIRDGEGEGSSKANAKVVELAAETQTAADPETPKAIEPEALVALKTPVEAPPFLNHSVYYHLPSRFNCNVLDDVMSLVLHVGHVQQDSITLRQHPRSVHIKFSSIGAGFFPTYYAFYVAMPIDCDVTILSAEAEAWENNVVVNLKLASCGEDMFTYLVGLDQNDLKEYPIQEKFDFAKIPGPPTSTHLPFCCKLNILVERSIGGNGVEIEIKPREDKRANGPEDEMETAANGGDEDDFNSNQRLSKKQKKKNKTRRSLSESACDEIKAYQKQQEEDAKDVKTKEKNSRTGMKRPTTASASVAVPTSSSSLAAQKRKQRSNSEGRDSLISSSGGNGSGSSKSLQPSKGILKRGAHHRQRPSLSESLSSIDNSVSPPSLFDEHESLQHVSQSFSDIPEESNSDGLSESCKKTVRFSEVIKKQVFRMDSSILGQRKKNQKRRDRKQRALQRRLSEGDSADYEDDKPVCLEKAPAAFLKTKGKTNPNNKDKPQKSVGNQQDMIATVKSMEHDSGVDLTTGDPVDPASTKNGDKTSGNSKAKSRPRLESESSTDADAGKNSLMFEMDM